MNVGRNTHAKALAFDPERLLNGYGEYSLVEWLQFDRHESKLKAMADSLDLSRAFTVEDEIRALCSAFAGGASTRTRERSARSAAMRIGLEGLDLMSHNQAASQLDSTGGTVSHGTNETLFNIARASALGMLPAFPALDELWQQIQHDETAARLDDPPDRDPLVSPECPLRWIDAANFLWGVLLRPVPVVYVDAILASIAAGVQRPRRPANPPPPRNRVVSPRKQHAPAAVDHETHPVQTVPTLPTENLLLDGFADIASEIRELLHLCFCGRCARLPSNLHTEKQYESQFRNISLMEAYFGIGRDEAPRVVTLAQERSVTRGRLYALLTIGKRRLEGLCLAGITPPIIEHALHSPGDSAIILGAIAPAGFERFETIWREAMARRNNRHGEQGSSQARRSDFPLCINSSTTQQDIGLPR